MSKGLKEGFIYEELIVIRQNIEKKIDTVRPLSSYLTNCVSESHAVLSSMLNLLVEINKEIMMWMISSSELNNKTDLTNLAI